MFTCENFSQISGWRCSKAPDESMYISSPVLLRDGTPLGFFLSYDNGIAYFSDEGITIFALGNQNLDMSDRRNWRGLESIVSNLGFKLAENGEITMSFPKSETSYWFSHITRLLGSIANWEQERIEQADTQFSLTREVEKLLKMKAPHRELTIPARAKIGKQIIDFDFLWGDTYIDAITPSARSTSSRLRKAIMARPLELHGSKILIIVDDRAKPEKAKSEISVLAQVCKTMTFSALESSATIH